DMEGHVPMQRAPDGLATPEGLSHQLEPGAVEDAAELHREGACRHLRCALATGLATRELPPPRGACRAGMRARRRSMCRHGDGLQKHGATQHCSGEGAAYEH